MAAKAWKTNDCPHQLCVNLLETWVDDAFGCMHEAEAAAARHRYSVEVHVHFEGPRCQHCSCRQCSSGCCVPPCKFPLTQCKATGAALMPPWEPCNDPAGGGSDQIYSTITSASVRHMNMNTQKKFGEEPLEKHKNQREKTHWEGGPVEGDGPQWDSPNPLESKWHWQLPHERNPATSTYPLLCELLNFCLRSQSAQALRSGAMPTTSGGFVEGWEAMMDNMVSSGATGLEHHHNVQGQGTERPHSDTAQ